MKKSLFLCLLFLCVWGTAWADFSKTWTSGANFSPWRPYGSLPSGMTCGVSRAYSLYEVEYVVSVASAGDVVVGLKYKDGNHGLRTLGVDLIGSDGTVSYNSYHEVNVGSSYRNSRYNYTLSSVAAGTYILRIIVCHESKDNDLAKTIGNITVTGADEVTTAGDIYTAYNSIASFASSNTSDTYVGAYTTELPNAASAYNRDPTEANLTALQDAHRTRQGGPNNRTVLANGEIFQIKCTDTGVNRGYLAYYNDTNVEDKVVLAGASYGSNTFPAITADGVYIGWAVYYYNDKYYLYNTQKKQFLKATSTQCTFTETAVDASPIILENTDGSLTEWLLKVAGTSNYICAAPGYANTNGAVRINNSTSDAGVKFNLIKVTDNGDILTAETATQNLMAGKILIPVLALKTPTLGTGIGEYTYSGSNQATDEANIATAKSYVDGTVTPTEAEILAAMTNMTNLYSSLTINQPTAGTLYRFIGKTSGKYMKSNGANQQMTVSASLANVNDNEKDNGPATIFMLTEDNKLLSYDLGLYANETRSIGSAVNNYSTYSFLKSEGGNVGYYTIMSNYSSAPYLWSNTSKTDRNGEYAEGNCDWEIEEVPYLPVPVYNDTYKLGTFYSPVALTQNTTRIKFYTGTVTNNYFNLTQYTGNVIPANTAFVTEYVKDGQTSNNCAYLLIASDPTPTAEQQKQLDSNQLQGQFETITTPTITGKTICTMQEISSALTFASYTGTTVKGFRAYLPVDNSTTGGGDSSFRLVFGVPTGIDTIGNQPAQEQTVYDLSGRRVEHAGKGLYIVNGKKVMIK